MVRHTGFEPVLVEILSFQPLPIGLLTRGPASEIRTHSDRFRKSNTVHRPRDLVASSGIEPLSMEVETPSPRPAARQKLEQVAGVKPAKDTLAMSPRITL